MLVNRLCKTVVLPLQLTLQIKICSNCRHFVKVCKLNLWIEQCVHTYSLYLYAIFVIELRVVTFRIYYGQQATKRNSLGCLHRAYKNSYYFNWAQSNYAHYEKLVETARPYDERYDVNCSHDCLSMSEIIWFLIL